MSLRVHTAPKKTITQHAAGDTRRPRSVPVLEAEAMFPRRLTRSVRRSFAQH